MARGEEGKLQKTVYLEPSTAADVEELGRRKGLDLATALRFLVIAGLEYEKLKEATFRQATGAPIPIEPGSSKTGKRSDRSHSPPLPRGRQENR